MDLYTSLNMFKDVADAGYKIRYDKLRKAGEEMIPDARKISLLGMLIPFYNMYIQIDKQMKYNYARRFLLDELSIFDSIEEMSSEELEEYSKNPTGLKAVFIGIKSEVEKENEEKGIKITIKDKNSGEESIAYIRFIDNEIKILECSGDLLKYSEEERIKIIKEKLKEFGNVLIDKYGSVDNAKDEMKLWGIPYD